MQLFFLIRSLNTGGAERQLVELVRGISGRGIAITVCLFYNEGDFRHSLKRLDGVKIITLKKSGRWDILGFLLRLVLTLRNVKPDIIYSFLPEANIIGLAAGVLSGNSCIVWGIRASDMDKSRYDRLFSLIIRLSTLLSRYPDMIIYNSHAGFNYHKRLGFKPKSAAVVHNGIDVDKFIPNTESRSTFRSKWGVDEKSILIGHVGRFDPMKDHPTLLMAMKIILKKRSDVCFVCVGEGDELYKKEMHLLSDKLQLRNKLIWAGLIKEMHDVYSAFDILLLSSSYGEGFPNVIGEAMSCGVPCVVTDVGDSKMIIGKTGVVVPAGNHFALAEGCLNMIESVKRIKNLSITVRNRIVKNYSTAKMVNETSELLFGLL